MLSLNSIEKRSFRLPSRYILVAAAAASLGACSNEALYQAIQENRLQACEEIPIAQQASCNAQYQTDYESYKRDRDALNSP